MRRTLNSLTTKLAGRVKLFLNILTALMESVAMYVIRLGASALLQILAMFVRWRPVAETPTPKPTTDNRAQTDAQQKNANRVGQPNGAAKQNTERNRRMKRTLNALTTKLAGRVQPFLNIPTALMMALAVGGFGLSLWMVDDSMKDRNAISHMRASSADHLRDPLTAQTRTDTHPFSTDIRGVGTVSVYAHYYTPSGAPASTWTVEATAYASVGVELTGTLPMEFCYIYALEIEGYARIGYYRNGRVLTYLTDNLKGYDQGLICRRKKLVYDPVTGGFIFRYVDDSPAYITDNAYAGKSLRYGASQHLSHESYSSVSVGAEPYRGPGIIHTLPTVVLDRTHGVP